MLVEDDKSLREIYGVRLLAEGYDIVSAGDGEEALAVAIKERPQLIISDVMMPKVSGYDMLDILRSTTETKNIKVIMMTALSSEEQRERAESLGSDRYLVKSQVGIEDVVRVVHEVLNDKPQAEPAVTPSANTTPTSPVPPVVPQPVPQPITQPTPPTNPVVPAPASQPISLNTMPITSTPRPATTTTTPKPASLKTRVIQPLNNPSESQVNINDLLDKELAKEAGVSPSDRPVVETIDQEKAQMEADLSAFIPPTPTPVTPAPDAPATAVIADNSLPTPGITSTTPQVTPTVTPETVQQPALPTVPSTTSTPPAEVAVLTPVPEPTQNTAPSASPPQIQQTVAPSVTQMTQPDLSITSPTMPQQTEEATPQQAPNLPEVPQVNP
jgi:CheY-like chemotaxis protein